MFSPFPHLRICSLSSLLLPFFSIFLFCILLLVACSDNTSSLPSHARTTASRINLPVIPPGDLMTPGTLTIGSDTTYLPQEFVDPTTHQVTGFDIDLISAIARRLNLKTRIVPDDFSALLPDLQAHDFDVAISAIGITAQRQQVASFIPYLRSGESLLVRAGNPLHVQALTDLCGYSAAAVDGTIEQADLNIASNTCIAAHKPAIHLIILTDSNAVIHLLLTGQVAATYQDAPVSDYFLKLYPQQLALCGTIVDWDTEGIAVRKGDTALKRALQLAMHDLEADGTYRRLLLKWGLLNEAITG